MEHTAEDRCNNEYEDTQVHLILIMQDGIQASEHAVNWVNGQPEEEVVLVVAPYYLYYYAAQVHLAYYYAVPYAVEQLETFFFMGCFSFFKIAKMLLVLFKWNYLLWRL